MSFQERSAIGENAVEVVNKLFKTLGFTIANFGYENILPKPIRNKIISLNCETAHFIRFMPDKLFVYKTNIFLTEVKVCDTPILYDGRVEKLKKISGVNTLSKKNIGAIETSAMNNYKKLSSIGIKILLVIHCTYHERPLVANWINNIPIIHQDKVIQGQGNASRTPYTNINLDDFYDIRIPLINEFGLEKIKVGLTYKEQMKELLNYD